jgi:hypothetical protein
VETAQVFIGQALKSKVKTASQDWRRFFVLTSSAFAMRENSPLVTGSPGARIALRRELREVVQQANIMQSSRDWKDAIHYLGERPAKGAYWFLLVLDSRARTLNIRSLKMGDMDEVFKAYDKAEKDTENNSSAQVVLVSVDNVNALHKAYRNYHADTSEFIQEVEKELAT